MQPGLKIFKFGGTSVGDAHCISRVREIVCEGSRQSRLVVVVSAMRGVTNKLVQAAALAEAGDEKDVADAFSQLRRQHHVALKDLIGSSKTQDRMQKKIDELLHEGTRLCQERGPFGRLTPAARDAVHGLGERLSILLVAAALDQHGVPSEAIEATELIVTDAAHGSANPCLDRTRARCQARLLPLVEKQLGEKQFGEKKLTPVVTGFIGATVEGALTTLGRGGSDYSAAILGGALDADEVVIWTDVDGMMTADPRLVPEASTLSAISYEEAAELAQLGAKVLHSKTLGPLLGREIPLSIRNTFAPENAGTRISSAAAANAGRVRAVTAMADAGSPVEAKAALVAVVGKQIRGNTDVVRQIRQALKRQNVEAMVLPAGASQNSISVAVAHSDVQAALLALHRQFQLQAGTCETLPIAARPSFGIDHSQPSGASAD